MSQKLKIINKIFHFLSSYKKKQILMLWDNYSLSNDSLQNTLHNIYLQINKKIDPDEHRQDYIIEKLHRVISTYVKPINNSFKIVDIGGGNGNILSGLHHYLHSSVTKDNFICIEQPDEWVETYRFNKHNVSYLFWDNKTMHIESTSVNLILIMVSLHHIKDEVIHNILSECYRILKPGGFIFLKEHNLTSTNKELIEWEHHLYHIVDLHKQGLPFEFTNYCDKNVFNFKSQEQWISLFTSYQLTQIHRFNRILETTTESYSKNPTELYWDIFQK